MHIIKKKTTFAPKLKIGYAEIKDSTLVNAEHFNEVKY